MPNNSLEHSASGAGPGILQLMEEMIEFGGAGLAREGPSPGRSLA